MPRIQALFPFIISLLLFSSCGHENGINIYSEEEDVALGKAFLEQIESSPEEYVILDDTEYPELYTRVRGMVDTIVSGGAVRNRNTFPWEVRILHDDTVLNAFCTPGGYLYVYTGLIRFLDSEDQLAGVLGHEIAHADLRHGTEQLTQQFGIRLLVQFIAGESDVLGNVAENIIGLAFSRNDETEADKKSVEYLAKTPYDPRGVARFFEKMEARGESMGALVFLSTHPNPENRVDAIHQAWSALGNPVGRRDSASYASLKALLP
jgi:beta-barrel assembly-enhancing protease